MIEFLLTVIVLCLLIVLAVIGIGVYILSKLLGGFGNVKKLFMKLTGWGKPKVSSDSKGGRAKQTSNNTSSSNANSSSASSSSSSSGNGGKIFNRNEGTYVDFEEIK